MSITLYQYPTAFGLPFSVSPFCTKLETYLRLTGREYDVQPGTNLGSPNRKVPYVAWEDERLQADSSEIIAVLETRGDRLDEGLTQEQVEAVRPLVELAETTVYASCLYARFSDLTWEHQKPTVRALVPRMLAFAMVPLVRRMVLAQAKRGGFSSPGDLGKMPAVVARFSEALGDKDYFVDEHPRIADCAIWAQLVHVAATMEDNVARAAVRNDARLMAYLRRLAAAARYPLPEWVQA